MSDAFLCTTGASASIVGAPQVPGGGQVVPVLQAQDGSFVGTDDNGDMVSFDAGGNTRWIVPGDTPQIATADGGVIGQSGITYDQNGNATGQVGLYAQSWRGFMYTDGQVQRDAVAPYPLADSGAQFDGGNNSHNYTDVLSVPKTMAIQVSPGGEPQDCYLSVGVAKGSYAERDITYQVNDQYQRQMPGMKIQEQLLPAKGTPCALGTNPQGGLCVGSWVTTGFFLDTLSANPQTGQSEYTQTFLVATPEGHGGYQAFYGPIPCIAAYQSCPSSSSSPSSNSLSENQFVISVNGNTGMKPDGVTPIRKCKGARRIYRNMSVRKIQRKIQGQATKLPGGTSPILDSHVAVHPDGTIFAIQYPEENAVPDSVIGLDPTTGAPKFTIQIPGSDKGETTVYGVIVAGDGYAYVPYGSREIDVIETNHLRLLRVNSSGASDDIDVYDWTSNIYDIFPFIFVGMITNADQGILLTWEDEEHWDPGNDYSDYSAKMAITTGTSASLVSTQQIGGAVFPMLQAQDGSFVAAGANPALYPASENAIFAFDASGNLRWVVPNDTPQIATADGGVIGLSGITYDQNGNATGIMTMPIQSWTGNLYRVGSVDQLAGFPVSWAGLWAIAQANPSGNLTAAQPLPDSVKAVYDVVGPDPLGNGAVMRDITYVPYQGKRQAVASQNVVIAEKLIYSYGQQPEPSQTNPGAPFYDEIGTRGKGPFGLTQQFFLVLPGIPRFRVQLVPCTAAETFGAPVWQNVIKATTQTVQINNDQGGTEARTCK